MASGEFVKILVYTDVTRYIEFKQISGSYFCKGGKIAKVPTTQVEAFKTQLISLFEKNRLRKFFEFLQKYKEDDPSTHQGLDLNKDTMETVYSKFGLEPGTQDFIGHALALHLEESYINQPAKETIEKILLYLYSMNRYGKSPYIYPMYGLGELPQGFAR